MTPIAKYFNLIPGKVYELYTMYPLSKDTDIRFYSEDHKTRIQYRELSVKKIYILGRRRFNEKQSWLSDKSFY